MKSALAAGMDQFLGKPLNYDQMKLLCDKHLHLPRHHSNN